MIEANVNKEMHKLELNLAKMQMYENPLVVMMLEEKMRVDDMKGKFMQEFSEKVRKIEKSKK